MHFVASHFYTHRLSPEKAFRLFCHFIFAEASLTFCNAVSSKLIKKAIICVYYQNKNHHKLFKYNDLRTKH